VSEALEKVGMAHRAKHLPSQLSGGQQQRVAVARALCGNPLILLADEPTGNLDSKAGTEILELLKRASVEHAQTVVMVTHDPRAAAYGNRILNLRDGTVVSDTCTTSSD
jgi:putative ABC transport system ATP-binding protein